MGVITKGFYKRGSKTSIQIAQLTGMAFQDTVFNTDTQQRLIYDGTNWVAGNQITLTFFQAEVSASAYITVSGAIVFPAPIADTSTDYTPIIKASIPSVIDTNSNMIGVIQGTFQYPKMITQNSSSVMQYSGLSYVLYQGYTGTYSGIQATYMNKSFAAGVTGPFATFYPYYGRAANEPSASRGNFGTWATRPTSQTLSFTEDLIVTTAYFTSGLGNVSLLESY